MRGTGGGSRGRVGGGARSRIQGTAGGAGALSAGTRPWLRGVLRCGLLLVAASLVVVPTAGASFAAGSTATATATATNGSVDALTQAEKTLQPILDQLHATYQQAEAATQTYDQLTEQLTQAQADDAELQVLVDNAQTSVDNGTTIAGQLATAQYRNSELSQLGQLLTAQDPEQALHTGELLAMAGKSQAAFIAQLKADQAGLVQAKAAAVEAKAHAAQLVAAQGVQRDTINKKLDQIRKQVASLTGVQQQELSQLEQKDADAAQTALLASGVLGKDNLKPSAAGAAAVAYAFQQIGAEYVWGGSGPYAAGFDCSGLTSQAWLHAGVAIPRTSEMQWAQLTHVPLDALRPGDLIVYFSGASHVAIYIGGGLVIQAPHTGAVVHVTPMAQNPILGAVRPDPDSPSLGSYKAPTIPKGATGAQPIGPGPVTGTQSGGSSSSGGSSGSSGTPTTAPSSTASASSSAKPSGSAPASGSAAPSASATASASASASASTSAGASAGASDSPSPSVTPSADASSAAAGTASESPSGAAAS
ncbi:MULTISPECIES: NlpC/P60 family protein [Streptacidiphilus]|uniref:NlpC/P60 family protein n=1 Tax=Streptacidiphilus cavernicola TaxID=3342716 RepID=A0ABV6UZ40_9ACTN|nr:C40 family peptidase [Streptacidiphilus jeojiense]